MGGVTLAEIGQDVDETLFPRWVLQGRDDALLLFAAGFLGKQDGYWVAMAEMQATCVDTDQMRLEQMATAYPEDWEFVTGDVYEYAARTRRVWDVVSVDCPSGQFERCADGVSRWCAVARHAVVLGTSGTVEVSPPVGWEVTERRFRSLNYGGTYWAVLERA